MGSPSLSSLIRVLRTLADERGDMPPQRVKSPEYIDLTDSLEEDASRPDDVDRELRDIRLRLHKLESENKSIRVLLNLHKKTLGAVVPFAKATSTALHYQQKHLMAYLEILLLIEARLDELTQDVLELRGKSDNIESRFCAAQEDMLCAIWEVIRILDDRDWNGPDQGEGLEEARRVLQSLIDKERLDISDPETFRKVETVADEVG